jgi:phage tail sheath protein FI
MSRVGLQCYLTLFVLTPRCKFIDGSRTLRGGSNFPYSAERRGVIFIERSLKQGLQFARHPVTERGLRDVVRCAGLAEQRRVWSRLSM